MMHSRPTGLMHVGNIYNGIVLTIRGDNVLTDLTDKTDLTDGIGEKQRFDE